MIRLLLCLTLALASCGPPTKALTDETVGDFKRSQLVSTSPGPKGGIVVLWPRVYPVARTAAYHDLAETLQHRLLTMARTAHPTLRVEARPEPERVCPDRGCDAAVLAVSLMTMGDACAAVATLARPGKSPWMLARWSSGVKLKAGSVGFRSPPENAYTVVEWVPCADLLKHLDHQPMVERALKNLIE